MNKYTIYCTPEQTKKAFELGAPIQFASINDIRFGRYIEVESNNETYEIPTTEQMIGWLEEQGIIYDLESCWGSYVNITVWDSPNRELVIEINELNCKEATLAAIDAALEYLENLKQ